MLYSFILTPWLLSDLANDNLVVDTNHFTVDVLNDMILLLLADTSVECHRPLTSYQCKSIHIIDFFKIIRAVAVLVERKTCSVLYTHWSWSSFKG